MEQHLDIRDRVWFFKKVPRCFIGREAVEWLVRSQLVSTVDEAVRIGQSLMQAHVIELASSHVFSAHTFKNEEVFYRFVSHRTLSSFKQSLASEATPFELTLAKNMRDGVDIFDRHQGLFGKTHKRSFTGQAATRWLLDKGLAVSEYDAERIGNRLVHTGLLQALGSDQEFTSGPSLYRFPQDDPALASSSSSSSFSSSSSSLSSALSSSPFRRSSSSSNSHSNANSLSSTPVTSSASPSPLLASAFPFPTSSSFSTSSSPSASSDPSLSLLSPPSTVSLTDAVFSPASLITPKEMIHMENDGDDDGDVGGVGVGVDDDEEYTPASLAYATRTVRKKPGARPRS